MRTAYTALAGITLVLVTYQFLSAGAGVFGATDGFDPHTTVAGPLHLPAFLMIVVAAIGRMGRTLIILPVAVLLLISLQYVLADARDDAPWIAALHPVNGLVIWYLTHVALLRSRRAAPVPAGAS